MCQNHGNRSDIQTPTGKTRMNRCQLHFCVFFGGPVWYKTESSIQRTRKCHIMPVPNLLSAQAIPLSEHVGSCIKKRSFDRLCPLSTNFATPLWHSKADVTSTSEGTCSIIQILLQKHQETVYIISKHCNLKYLRWRDPNR